MHVINSAFLKAPLCDRCHSKTKLCSGQQSVFAMVWQCSECGTEYDYHTGYMISYEDDEPVAYVERTTPHVYGVTKAKKRRRRLNNFVTVELDDDF